MCEKIDKESYLLSSCVSRGNVLPRSMVKIKGVQGVWFFPFGAPTPPHLSSPTLPRVSITVSLHLSLARTGRSFLMLVHTHAQTHTHAHKYGVEHTFEHKLVECATHTLLILICSMLSFVNTEKSRFPCVCKLCERRYW